MRFAGVVPPAGDCGLRLRLHLHQKGLDHLVRDLVDRLEGWVVGMVISLIY